MPFLSVIVPIYNAEAYLEECLDSIISQTFEDFELILVNDGSVDGSKNICIKYANKYKNIKFIDKKNKGVVSARKAGVSYASGKYIGWVDADDCIMPQMFEKMCNEANESDADVVICDIWSWEKDKLIPLEQTIDGGRYNKEELAEKFYPYMLYSGMFYRFGILPAYYNKIIKREIIEKNICLLDDRISLGEDAACTYFCMLDANSISYLKNEFLYKYRTNAASLCHLWKNEKIESISFLLNYMYNRLKLYDLNCMLEQYWYYMCWIYTNLIYEYNTYMLSNKMPIEDIGKRIILDNELRENFIKSFKIKESNLPFDRKIIAEVMIGDKSQKKLLACIIIKVKSVLMLAYDLYNKKINGIKK